MIFSMAMASRRLATMLVPCGRGPHPLRAMKMLGVRLGTAIVLPPPGRSTLERERRGVRRSHPAWATILPSSSLQSARNIRNSGLLSPKSSLKLPTHHLGQRTSHFGIRVPA
eukprot:COSAG01_NODE_13696_length_1547_cov_1.068370_1_plen_112_part_00